MMKSPAHPKYEASHYDDYGFDLQEEFSQFLEEAKQYGKEAKLKSSSVHPEESTRPDKEKKKGKKSWKSSLVSWWKAGKKSKLREEEPTKNNPQSKASGKRHGHVSGPIYNNKTNGPDGKHWHSTSGPLTSLFKGTKRKESEVPYMSLHQQSRPHASQNYGPLYVVT